MFFPLIRKFATIISIMTVMVKWTKVVVVKMVKRDLAIPTIQRHAMSENVKMAPKSAKMAFGVNAKVK